MGSPKPPLNVKLVAAITFKEPALLDEARKLLQAEFGPIDLESGIYDFNHTRYYVKEMGSDLKKQFVSFTQLIRPDFLVEAKLRTNELEKQLSLKGRRRVNIDPGYVAGAKLVLATTKNYDHRIYLRDGIYGDVHLRFRGGHFHINEWTYPDYRQQLALEFFERVRKEYLKALKR